ncbi:MAG: VanZ family protein [Vicinamibacterales bacterium]
MRALRLWLPVIGYMAVIFYVSSLSDAPLPQGVTDISAHMLGYVGLGVVCARAFAGGLPARMTPGIAAAALALAVGYGVTDELHQMFVPGRSAELKDLGSDAVGAAAGIVACWAWGIIWLRAGRHDF